MLQYLRLFSHHFRSAIKMIFDRSPAVSKLSRRLNVKSGHGESGIFPSEPCLRGVVSTGRTFRSSTGKGENFGVKVLVNLSEKDRHEIEGSRRFPCLMKQFSFSVILETTAWQGIELWVSRYCRFRTFLMERLSAVGAPLDKTRRVS